MEAGKELDALIAERIMGWQHEHHEPPSGAHVEPRNCGWCGRSYHVCGGSCHYSSDIAAAWTVVSALQERGWSMLIAVSGQSSYRLAKFQVTLMAGKHEYHSAADTAPLAIVRAALLAAADWRKGKTAS